MSNNNKFGFSPEAQLEVRQGSGLNLKVQDDDKSNGNFKDFLSNSDNIMLISDTEGQLSTSIDKKIDDHSGKFVFLGDMGDYTGNFFNKTNLVFLKYINQINNNPEKYAAVLGNRDLNKLCLWQLVQFVDGSKWWKNGDNVVEIANNLVSKINGNKLEDQHWLVKELNSFAPYWNDKHKDYTNWTGHTKYTENPTLYNRYLSIFGLDPKDGTMSAGNTIKGLLIDAGLGEQTDTELGAAMVFTLYARMLDPELAVNPQTLYDGCLYTYLTNTPIVAYAEINGKIYLFSHGGIHSDFTDTVYNIVSDFVNRTFGGKQYGGNINNLNNISLLNQEVHKNIVKFYKETLTKEQNNTLRTLLALACPIGKSTLTNAEKYSYFGQKYTDSMSPIMPAINTQFDMLAKDEYDLINGVDNKNIYNIFGHAPFGFGYGFKNGINGQHLVCCDFSSSGLRDNPTSFDDNNLTLTFNPSTGEFKVDGSINISSDKYPIQIVKDIKDDTDFTNNKTIVITKNELSLSDGINIKINYKNGINFNDIVNIDHIDPNVYWAYHGIGDINNNRFKIFGMVNKTTSGPPNFKKHLVLIPIRVLGSNQIRVLGSNPIPVLGSNVSNAKAARNARLRSSNTVIGKGPTLSERMAALGLPQKGGSSRSRRVNKTKKVKKSKTKKNRKSVNKKRTRKH